MPRDRDLGAPVDPTASILLVSWGSTYGAVRSAVSQSIESGVAVALIHLRYLNPLPRDLGDLLARYKRILVVELNTGQLCQLLRAQYLVNAESVSQCNGQSFSVSRLVAIIQESRLNE